MKHGDRWNARDALGWLWKGMYCMVWYGFTKAPQQGRVFEQSTPRAYQEVWHGKDEWDDQLMNEWSDLFLHGDS